MKTMTKIGYAFISNDLKQNNKDDRNGRYNGNTKSKNAIIRDPCITYSGSDKYIQRRGPAERKLTFRSRIRNSWSSDAIRLLSLNHISEVAEELPEVNSSDSSVTSSPVSNGPSVNRDLKTPLIRRPKRSYSIQGIVDEQRLRFRWARLHQYSEMGEGVNSIEENSISHKARKFWAALERRFGHAPKFPTSASEGNLKKMNQCSTHSDHMASAHATERCIDCTICKRASRLNETVYCDELHPKTPAQTCTTRDLWDLSHCQTNKSITESKSTLRSDTATGQFSKHYLSLYQNPMQQTGCRIPRSSTWMAPSHAVPTTCPTGTSVYVLCTNNELSDLRQVILKRADNGERFGMSIESVGRRIFLSKVLRDSPADWAGLKIGDELVYWDGYPLNQLSLSTILEMIRSAPNCLSVVYRPRKLLSKFRKICLKKTGGRIGIRLEKRQNNIYVNTVLPDSSAHRSGIQKGDEIVQINEQTVRGWSQAAVLDVLREISGDESIHFVIRQVDTLPEIATDPLGLVNADESTFSSDENERIITEESWLTSAHIAPGINPEEGTCER